MNIDYKLYGGNKLVLRDSLKNENYSLDLIYDALENKVDKYDERIAVVRRATVFELICRFSTAKLSQDLGVKLITKSLNELNEIILSSQITEKEGFSLSISNLNSHTVSAKIRVSIDSPVGLYKVEFYENGEKVTDYLTFYVIFNPFDSSETVFTADNAIISEYLLNERTVVFSGSNEYYSGIHYDLGIYSIECVMVWCYFISRMQFSHRRDPVLVSRYITQFVNGNDDYGLMYDNWKKITYGTSPLAWRDMKDIYIEYLNQASPVKWGQCFVFGALTASGCRNMGIACRTVSIFNSGHDNEKDGILKIYLDEETMQQLGFSETLWNFHVVNNAIIKRKDIHISNTETDVAVTPWQHIDGTPQDRSQEIFQCGPYSVELLRRRIINKDILYDGLPIDCSINAITKYYVLNKKKEVVKQYDKNNCANLIVTNSAYGYSIDITKEYKTLKKIDIPRDDDLPKKIIMSLQVPASSNIYDALDYSIEIQNSSQNSSTVLLLSLELRSEIGVNILKSPVTNSIVFSDSNFSFTGKFDSVELKDNVDLSMAIFYWELRCFDHKLDKLKVMSHQTQLIPSITGQIEVTTFFLDKPWTDIRVNVKNQLLKELKNCSITVTIKDNWRQKYEQEIPILLPGSDHTLRFTLEDLARGYQTIEAWLNCDYFHGQLDKKNIIVRY